MNALAGTFRLLKLALRIDRIKLPVWIISIVGIIALTLPQLISAYSAESQRILYASASASSAATRFLAGALTGPSIGEITVIETYLIAVILIGLMNIFLITRHTRSNEETGRSELIGSMVVGRQAQLTATLILAFATNVVVALLISGVFLLNQLPASGSIAYGLSIGILGFMFAAITAVTSQLYENTRAASGLAGLILGVSFAVRGIADTLGTIRQDGLGVITSDLSWASPLGWVLQVRPFADEQWWVFGLFALSIPVLIVSAYLLLSRRDVGSGLFASRAGKEAASSLLLSRFGLLWRLNRTSFIAWLCSIAAMGIAIGAVADEFSELIASNEEMKQMLEMFGGANNLSDIMFSAMFVILGIATAAYTLQIFTRMKSEETSGRLEVVLSSSVSRTVWLMQYIAFALFAAFTILVVTGAVTGLTYGIITGTIIDSAVRLVGAILIQLPSILVLIGIAVLLFGAFARHSTALTWFSLAYFVLIFQLGTILNLPQWAINSSPFTHTPSAPSDTLIIMPLIIQLFVGISFLSIGVLLFKRRDIKSQT